MWLVGCVLGGSQRAEGQSVWSRVWEFRRTWEQVPDYRHCSLFFLVGRDIVCHLAKLPNDSIEHGADWYLQAELGGMWPEVFSVLPHMLL